MQEQLNFSTMPEIDTSRLSNIEDFMNSVDRFQQRYDINLEFNENARWRPGSYERLKQQLVDSLFPHWLQSKGANSIKRLTRFDKWRFDSCVRAMHEIDAQLKVFRACKASLNRDDAREQGKIALDEISPALLKKYNDIEINILPLPFYQSKNRRSDESIRFNRERGHLSNNISIFQSEWDKGINPIFTRNSIKFDPTATFSRPANGTYNDVLEAYKINTNPQRWWVNVSIVLKDVNINYIKGVDETLVTIPYGDIIVTFSMSIYDMILNYKKIKTLNAESNKRDVVEVFRKMDLSRLTNHAITFPHVSGIEHPFIYRDSNQAYNTYQRGNICFGDLDDDITSAFLTANFEHLKTLLRIWAETYYVGNTSPLNQPHTHHIGMPKSWNLEIQSSIATAHETCRTVIDRGYDDYGAFVEEFCNDCQLTNTCKTHKMLIRKEHQIGIELIDLINTIVEDEVYCIPKKWWPETKKALQSILYKIYNCIDEENKYDVLTKALTSQTVMTNCLLKLDAVEYFKTIKESLFDVLEYEGTDIPVEEIHEDIIRTLMLLFLMSERNYLCNIITALDSSRYKTVNDNYCFNKITELAAGFPIEYLYQVANTTCIEHGNSNPIKFADSLIINNSPRRL